MQGKRQPIPKVPTKIAGLDEILEGGIPRGRTTVISGGPGSGKTVLGLEFLCRGAMAAEPGVFVTFEERAEAIRLNALAMGWDLAALEKAGKASQVKVIGFDGMPEGKQAIKDGKIYADPVQFPDRIGQQTVQAIVKYMAGDDVPSQILIPTALYRKADAIKDPVLK